MASGPALAQQSDIAQAMHNGDWLAAAAAAAASPDPLATKLVTYYRLLHPGDGHAAEISAFLAANPDWPATPLLLKRRDEALAQEGDNAVVLSQCSQPPTPRTGEALARCADAQAAAGHDGAGSARLAWAAGFADPDEAARFLTNWRSALTAQDQWRHFLTLLAANPPAATQQIALLAPPDQALARARLAVRHDDPRAASLLAAVPASLRHDPALVLDQARAQRRQNDDAAALRLWNEAGYAAEQQAGPDHAAEYGAERSQLARRLLRAGDDRGAYALADDPLQHEAEAQTETDFLAGFIALRRLRDPALAAGHFARLAAMSGAAISQARAHYWLGRTATARGDDGAARAEYAAAAAWPTTYYGQLAALALGDGTAALQARIEALRDPAWTSAQALAFVGRELTRAAAALVAWGDPGRAHAFLQQVAALATDAPTRSLVAHLALGLDLPDQAVAVARRAGRDGTMLAEAGWPIAADMPDQPAPASLGLGIIRQESSFEIGAISPSGARGLMQLMPATAAALGRQLGDPVPTASLTSDAAGNIRLGTAYLGQLVARFGGSLPLAIAAYNAGPNRVDEWLGENGDPRTGAVPMIDWIELIPFSETRNYVQRVVENTAMYRAKRHEDAAYPVQP